MFADILVIVAVAGLNVYVGSSLKHWHSQAGKNKDGSSASATAEDESPFEEQVDLTLYQVLAIPVTSSLMLLLLLYFFDWVQYLLVPLILLSSFTSTQFVLSGLLYCASSGFTKSCWCISRHTKSQLEYATWLLAAALTLSWLVQDSVLVHDVLASCLAVTFISLVRFPNLKLATLCLGMLLVYDIYWVFFSEYMFQTNVMVTVATKASNNPIQSVAKMLHIPVLRSIKSNIELPLKLIFPADIDLVRMTALRYSMLGLGDITIPGMLIAYVHDMDVMASTTTVHGGSSTGNSNMNINSSNSHSHAHAHAHVVHSPDIEEQGGKGKADSFFPAQKRTGRRKRLFAFGMGGYILGLLTAILANRLTQHAQPALLYLVPFVLIAVGGRAIWEGRFSDVWNGSKVKDHSED